MGETAARMSRWLRGRSRRGTFWLILGATGLASILSLVVSGILMEQVGDWGVAPSILVLLAGATLIVAATPSRLHDLGWSGWWTLLYLIPFVGVALLVPLLLLRGRFGMNRYGDDPRLAHVSPEQRLRRESLEPCLAAAVAAAHRVRDLQQEAIDRQAEVDSLSSSHEGSETRLRELESGRGALVASVADASLYEFWLQLPAYSGPVFGATARLSESGNVYSVSNVSGNTKGGVGGAVAGGLIAGPVGAIVGSNVGRKTTVETTTRTVDARSYELEIIGPGFAHSIRRSRREELQRFRDLVNARGSCDQQASALVASQRDATERLRQQLHQAVRDLETMLGSLGEAEAASLHAWNVCRTACLSMSDRVRVWRVMKWLPPMTAIAAPMAGDQPLALSASPGWYEDPTARHQQRYWDGTTWSGYVADNGVVVIDGL